jgi:guanosine-3',5'-bis(diphosphate) 3'-pyrophosphohydrolase
MTDAARIALAYDLAARRHAGQVRRGAEALPYINHPIAVARLVAGAGADVDTVIAAVLHDTVEDTQTSLEEVKRLFGAQVAETVAALTSPAAWDALPLTEKKALQAAHIRRASAAARLVKLADQTANLTDMAVPGTGWTAERMQAYLDGARAIAAECRGLSKALDAGFASAAAQVETYLKDNP